MRFVCKTRSPRLVDGNVTPEAAACSGHFRLVRRAAPRLATADPWPSLGAWGLRFAALGDALRKPAKEREALRSPTSTTSSAGSDCWRQDLQSKNVPEASGRIRGSQKAQRAADGNPESPSRQRAVVIPRYRPPCQWKASDSDCSSRCNIADVGGTRAVAFRGCRWHYPRPSSFRPSSPPGHVARRVDVCSAHKPARNPSQLPRFSSVPTDASAGAP
jgi:hypothetical protein